jgi:hypothetical protein
MKIHTQNSNVLQKIFKNSTKGLPPFALTDLQKQIKLPTYGAVLPCRAMKKSLIPSTIENGSQVVKNRSIPCIVRTGKSCREESALSYPQYPFRFSLHV